MILIDLHIHSNFSDGKHAIPEIVDFYGTRGFKVIAITDHLCEEKSFLGRAAGYLGRTLTRSTFPLYLEILRTEQARAWEQYGMIVIPGYEVTKNSISNQRSAHMLGIGISEYVRADDSIEEILMNILKQGALTIAAHPTSTKALDKQTLHLWDRREELKHLFDAWEVGTAKYYLQDVADSGLPVIATTDLHHFGQMTGWKTILDLELDTSATIQDNIEAAFKTIREQKLVPYYYREDQHGVPFPMPVLELGGLEYRRQHRALPTAS